jgi:hypothetical protein
VPEPVLVSIAAAAASRTVAGLYKLIKDKFSDDPVATAVLEAAEGTAEDSQEVQDLSATLEHTAGQDSAFSEELRELWHQANVAQRGDSGGVANQVSGTVHGNVVQARDISGGITF